MRADPATKDCICSDRRLFVWLFVLAERFGCHAVLVGEYRLRRDLDVCVCVVISPFKRISPGPGCVTVILAI